MKSFKNSAITNLLNLFSELVVYIEYTGLLALQFLADVLRCGNIWYNSHVINLAFAYGTRLPNRHSKLRLLIVILFDNLFERALK